MDDYGEDVGWDEAAVGYAFLCVYYMFSIQIIKQPIEVFKADCLL